MIKLLLNNYKIDELELLHEMLQNNLELLADEKCLRSIPVIDPQNLQDQTTIFCFDCPYKWLCQDLGNDIDYLESVIEQRKNKKKR